MSSPRNYPFSTGEFEIPKLKSDCKMVSAVFNGELHLIGGNLKEHADWYRAHYFKHMKFSLDKLNSPDKSQKDWDAEQIKHPDNWEEIPFSVAGNQYASSPYDYNNNLTHSDNMSLVATSSALFLFRIWSDGGNLSIIASKYQLMEDKGAWGNDITLYNPGGKSIVENFGAVSACLFGDTQILVAACGTSAHGQNSKPFPAISLFLFDTRDIKVNEKGKSIWIAKSDRKIYIQDEIKYYMGLNLLGHPPALVSGTRMDIDWVYTMKPDGEDKGTIEYYLALAFAPSIPWNESYTYTGFVPLSLKTSEGGQSLELADDPWDKGILEVYNQGDGLESSLKRDPSGRLQRFSRISENKFSAIYFSTAEPPTLKKAFGNQPQPYPEYRVTGSPTTVPSNTYYTFAQGEKKVKTTGKNKKGEPVKVNGVEYPVLEFIFYGDNKCQLHDYGKIVIAKDKQYLKQKGELEKVIIGGYFDGPIPFPVQNFVGQKLSNNDYEIGTFVYKVSRESEKEFGLETDWTIGFEADFKTTKGIGPAGKIAFEGGKGKVEKNTFSSDIERGVPVNASVKSYDNSEKPYAEGNGIVSALKAQFTITGFQFYNAQGKLVNDALSGDPAQSLKMGAVLTRMQAADSPLYAFEPFVVTPGDLLSYTPEAINRKMNKLGYKGANYFGEVICRNAYPISGLPFLPFSWVLGDANEIDTLDAKSSFTEQSWNFDLTAYAGVSGGEEVSFFGFGEGFEASAMFGGSYSRHRTESDMKKSGWGIEISKDWGPIVPEEGKNPKDAVKSYSFRMYFLPVPKGAQSTRWTEELIKYLPSEMGENSTIIKEMIDKSSGSWRISFVVDKIICYDEKSKYNYKIKDKLTEPSIYK